MILLLLWSAACVVLFCVGARLMLLCLREMLVATLHKRLKGEAREAAAQTPLLDPRRLEQRLLACTASTDVFCLAVRYESSMRRGHYTAIIVSLFTLARYQPAGVEARETEVVPHFETEVA